MSSSLDEFGRKLTALRASHSRGETDVADVCDQLRDLCFGMSTSPNARDRAASALSFLGELSSNPRAIDERGYWGAIESTACCVRASDERLTEELVRLIREGLPVARNMGQEIGTFRALLSSTMSAHEIRDAIFQGLLLTRHLQLCLGEIIDELNRRNEDEYGEAFDRIAGNFLQRSLETRLFTTWFEFYNPDIPWTVSRYVRTHTPRHILAEWERRGRPADHDARATILIDWNARS
ncbi:hypothetical protein [Bradyrhizobium sp. sGM-13]|uniref:hypothetical protein n=1 Tax=Bradyrhizobium sp. sGM-13 TaxID=2831781 RepID=UPI001BD0CAA0|nr:hypothetical protein [Bradyrhizobium sp. sGM-13]